MQQQAYPQQNKGTLVPGQTISVNKYTVQVERYLSQGVLNLLQSRPPLIHFIQRRVLSCLSCQNSHSRL